MLQIGICDDIPQQAEIFQQRLLTGNYTQQELVVHTFHSAQELLSSAIQLDMLFLDIDMPEMSGIELLEKHNTHFSDTKVIFLTSHINYVFDGYKYHIYRFLQKGNISDENLIELFSSFEQENILNQTLSIHSNGADISILFKDIIFIESISSYCYVITANKRWKCYIRLKDLENYLPKDYFFKTHKSYIINMKNIQDIYLSKNYIIMSDGSRVDISQRLKKKFKLFYAKS